MVAPAAGCPNGIGLMTAKRYAAGSAKVVADRGRRAQPPRPRDAARCRVIRTDVSDRRHADQTSSINAVVAIPIRFPLASEGRLAQLAKVMATARPLATGANAVGPGAIMTDMLQGSGDTSRAKRRIFCPHPARPHRRTGTDRLDRRCFSPAKTQAISAARRSLPMVAGLGLNYLVPVPDRETG